MNATETITPCTERRDKGTAGDVTALIDQASGAVVATYTYSAYGIRTAGEYSDPEAVAACAWGFDTYYWDADAGVYLLPAGGHWPYNPELGRWHTRDPLGQGPSPGHYPGFSGDPVNRIDPDGMADTPVDPAPKFDFSIKFEPFPKNRKWHPPPMRENPMYIFAFEAKRQIKHESEIERAFSELLAQGHNSFLLSDGDGAFPMLSIAVNGQSATMIYLPRENDPGWRSLATTTPPDGQSLFCFQGPNQQEPVSNRFVIPYTQAVCAAKEFFRDKQLPTSVKWLDL